MSLQVQLTAPTPAFRPSPHPRTALNYPNPLHQNLTPSGLFINNEFVEAKSGKTIVAIDPATEKTIAEVQAAGEEEIDIAVKAARKAFENPEWKDLDTSERGKLLLKLSDNGKPYTAAMAEDVAEVISVFQYYGGWADKNHGQMININSDKWAYTRHEPVGRFSQFTAAAAHHVSSWAMGLTIIQ
ncbi:aldehyde dehydrogenase n-terminal [Fusarium subglutinans]|uniref:aldehyde dehydrogenase (NAD(+)) n=1 Tax=Gibberella subglutinans TaxID=42677 RepID=A0A8H5NPQ8_GIBSU|nr:aldehyde dehydrogenase n-terminal [Fusarium subglutinans]KAF5573444.1 aldehyde dehydrogenase n-terminal [Fusarium subglutinans]